MIEITSCAVCDGPIRHVKRALVAPFLAKRIWNRKPFSLDLVRCQACGFMFYNPRLDDAELQRKTTAHFFAFFSRIPFPDDGPNRLPSFFAQCHDAVAKLDDIGKADLLESRSKAQNRWRGCHCLDSFPSDFVRGKTNYSRSPPIVRMRLTLNRYL